jgi:hypothetical protein
LKEPAPDLLVHSSPRDCDGRLSRFPSDESLGDSQMSLRDNVLHRLTVSCNVEVEAEAWEKPHL